MSLIYCTIRREKSIFIGISVQGITSGRGYAHGEVGIVYIDIESVCIPYDIAHL